MEIGFLAGESLVENAFKFVALLRPRQASRLRVVNKKRVQNDVVRSRENLRGQNIETRGAKRSGNLAEKPGPVPGANLDRITGPVGLVVPIDYRCQGILFF